MAKVKTNFKTKRKTYIREWRKFRGLILDQLAERVGVSTGNISQLERGNTSYTQPMLEALADALRCEPAELLMRDPKADEGIMLVWSKIPENNKSTALQVLRAFVARTGTAG